MITLPRAGLAIAALAFGAAAVTVAPPPAQACGGFFCAQVPVDQLGEQIIFGFDNGRVTAQILINYVGEAEDFAWLLPIPSEPEIRVGSNTAFQVVQSRTQPFFDLRWDNNDGECGGWGMWLAEMDAGAGDPSPGPPSVDVIAQKDVGPFRTVVLKATDTQELVDWLDEHGYDQPPSALPLIEHYVQQDMYFVALRLKSGESTGSIQPIVLEFDEEAPCVPLVLTQIAAVPDMPVRLYLAGEHRTVPSNWLHVVVNEKKIDWLNFGRNYNDVVTQAVDEASGRAFVTEYAGDSALLAGAIYTEGRFDLDALATLDDPIAFMNAIISQRFPSDSTMMALLQKHIPMPEALVGQVDERSFYNNLDAYAEHLEDLAFDPAAFVTDLEERIVAPLRDTQAIFDRAPYLTRLFTTISPDEMTRDPIFVQNADLPEVSNARVAQAEAECAPGDDQIIDRIHITIPNGETMTLEGPFDRWCPGCTPPTDPAPEEPAAERIELIGATGPPVLIDPSDAAKVDQSLHTSTPDRVIDDLIGDGFPRPPMTPGPGGSSGCAAGGELPLGALVAVAALGLLFWRRREPARPTR